MHSAPAMFGGSKVPIHSSSQLFRLFLFFVIFVSFFMLTVISR